MSLSCRIPKTGAALKLRPIPTTTEAAVLPSARMQLSVFLALTRPLPHMNPFKVAPTSNYLLAFSIRCRVPFHQHSLLSLWRLCIDPSFLVRVLVPFFIYSICPPFWDQIAKSGIVGQHYIRQIIEKIMSNMLYSTNDVCLQPYKMKLSLHNDTK